MFSVSKTKKENEKAFYNYFANCYEEAKSFVEKEKELSLAVGNSKYFLFGEMESGKSTFLARLKSQLSPSEFNESVLNRKEDTIVIEGVTISKDVLHSSKRVIVLFKAIHT